MDTLNPTDTGEKQMDLFSMNEENTDRIKRQNKKKSQLLLVILLIMQNKKILMIIMPIVSMKLSTKE